MANVDARRADEAKVTLPSEREIVVVRLFRAPRDAVFEAWSNPERVKRWYPCEAMTMPVCESDFRVGGAWPWVQRESTGEEHALSGEYREIRSPDRIVFTERYEPIPGSHHLVTLTFEDGDGVTLFTQRFLHPSKEARDGHLRSGVEGGIQATFARMDDMLVSIEQEMGQVVRQ